MAARFQPLPGGGFHGDLPDGWIKSLTHEVALALSMPAVSADKLLWLAWNLQAALPGTGDLLAAGELTLAKARAVDTALGIMGDMTVTGIDGCAVGWVAVTLGPESSPAAPEVRTAVAKTLDGLPLTGVTGIDMPLGLLDAGWRDADLRARRVLGRRGATVFAIPPQPVWDCETYAEANRVCRDLTGKGFSVQAWGLRRKIAEADDFRRRARSASSPVRLYEVHPELSFTVMAGAPVPDSKHTAAGLAVRRALLAAEGITVGTGVTGAAADDLLDAAAVAWSARRVAAGQATVLASPAQRAADGSEIAIRY